MEALNTMSPAQQQLESALNLKIFLKVLCEIVKEIPVSIAL
jgi:hypothetical protein